MSNTGTCLASLITASGIIDLSNRFSGISIDCRNHNSGTGWPGPWRVRLLVAKGGRSDYRLTTYGQTMDEAVAALITQVQQKDSQNKVQIGTWGMSWEKLPPIRADWYLGNTAGEVATDKK